MNNRNAEEAQIFSFAGRCLAATRDVEHAYATKNQFKIKAEEA
jgi:hypothetical protein